MSFTIIVGEDFTLEREGDNVWRVKMPKLIDIEYELLITETEKAYMFLIDKKEVWIPKSIAELDIDTETVTIPEKFAFDKGLI